MDRTRCFPNALTWVSNRRAPPSVSVPPRIPLFSLKMFLRCNRLGRLWASLTCLSVAALPRSRASQEEPRVMHNLPSSVTFPSSLNDTLEVHGRPHRANGVERTPGRWDVHELAVFPNSEQLHQPLEVQRRREHMGPVRSESWSTASVPAW